MRRSSTRTSPASVAAIAREVLQRRLVQGGAVGRAGRSGVAAWPSTATRRPAPEPAGRNLRWHGTPAIPEVPRAALPVGWRDDSSSPHSWPSRSWRSRAPLRTNPAARRNPPRPPPPRPGNPAPIAANPPGVVATTNNPNLAVATVKLENGLRAQQGHRRRPSRGDNDQEIGKVDDLVMTDGNKVTVAVVAVGGFLGLGSKLVAFPYDQLKINGDRVTLPGVTKDSLNAMPNFQYQ